jgi:hypothetical protein
MLASGQPVSDGEQEKQVSAKQHVAELREAAHPQGRKETLSAYFTIAAAAFGLIR